MQAIVKETGERIRVSKIWGGYANADKVIFYLDRHLTVLDTPEEGD